MTTGAVSDSSWGKRRLRTVVMTTHARITWEKSCVISDSGGDCVGELAIGQEALPRGRNSGHPVGVPCVPFKGVCLGEVIETLIKSLIRFMSHEHVIQRLEI